MGNVAVGAAACDDAADNSLAQEACGAAVVAVRSTNNRQVLAEEAAYSQEE